MNALKSICVIVVITTFSPFSLNDFKVQSRPSTDTNSSSPKTEMIFANSDRCWIKRCRVPGGAS